MMKTDVDMNKDEQKDDVVKDNDIADSNSIALYNTAPENTLSYSGNRTASERAREKKIRGQMDVHTHTHTQACTYNIWGIKTANLFKLQNRKEKEKNKCVENSIRLSSMVGVLLNEMK